MTVTAACGHQIDFPFHTTNIICKDCFEAQGFVYNENSYRDLQHAQRFSARSGMGKALAGSDDRRAEMKRECARILNPVLQLPGKPGHKHAPARREERRAAFALVQERYGIGRSTATQYAKEFRTAA